MAKRTKKKDAQHKNRRDTEFSEEQGIAKEEMGSEKANEAHKERAKQARKDGWKL